MKKNASKRSDSVACTAPDEQSPACPEAVFLAWLLWLPAGREPRSAALDEIARIDRHPVPLTAEAGRLRAMFAALLATETAHESTAPVAGNSSR